MRKDEMRKLFWKYVAPGKPDNLKHAVYLLASIVLGILIGFIAYAFIEIKTIHRMYHQGNLAYFDSGRKLFRILEYAFLISSAASGLLVGQFCWRKIYVERVWKRIIK